LVAQAFATMPGIAAGMLSAAGIPVGMRRIVELSKGIVIRFMSGRFLGIDPPLS
jgi:hypothetical protein